MTVIKLATPMSIQDKLESPHCTWYAEARRDSKIRRGELVIVAPPTAFGVPTVWGPGGECLRLTQGQAIILSYIRLIYYSPGDGPNARVYRPCEKASSSRRS